MNKFDIKLKSALSVLLIVAACVLCLSSCSAKKAETAESIAVFVPGVVTGNPVYEMLANGVKESVDAWNAKKGLSGDAAVKCTVIEAGTNQAEWGTKLTAVASSGEYTAIISSNSSLPALVEPLTKTYPNVKFVLLDAYLEGNASVATARYNQREQAYMAGFAAASVTASNMALANPEHKIALLAAQEYPVMNDIILPAYIEGARAAVPDVEVDFVTVGNWYDASKGMELSEALYKSGVDVILPIAGGAAQGVIAAAEKLGFYIAWFDDNGYSKAPGYVISSTVMAQNRKASEITTAYLDKTLKFGTAVTEGIAEGYVSFVDDDELFIQYVPEEVRSVIVNEYNRIKNGQLLLPSN